MLSSLSSSGAATLAPLAVRQTKLLSWSPSEEHLFAHIHSQCGNRWAEIAKRLKSGRTPNDVKNMWHSTLRAKVCRRNSFLFTYLRHLGDNWDNAEARAAAYDHALRDMNDGALEPARLSRRVRRALKAVGLATTTGLVGQHMQPTLEPQQGLGLAGVEGATLLVPLDDKPARARSRPMQIRLMPGTLDPRGRSQSPPEIAGVLAAAAGAAAAVGVAPLEPLQPLQPLQPPEGLAPQLPPQLPHVPPARERRPQSHLQLQVHGQQHEDLTPDMRNSHVSDSGHSTRATSADGGASVGSETSSGVAGRMLPRSSGGVLGSYASGLLSVPAAAASAASVVPAAAAEAALSHHQQQELGRGYARQTQLSAITSGASTAVEVPVLRQQSGRQPQQQHQQPQPLQHTRPSQAQPPMAVHGWPPPSSGQHHHQPQQSSRSDQYASAPAAMALRRSSPGVTDRGAGGAQGGLQLAPAHGQSSYQQPQPQRVQERQQDSFGCGDMRDLHARHLPQSHVLSLCSASALSNNLRFAHPQQHVLRQLQQQHQQRPLQHSSPWHQQQTQQQQQTQPEVINATMDDGPMPARPARHMRSGGDNSFGGHRCSAPGNIAAAHDGVPVLDNYQDACYHWRPPSQPHAMVAQQQQQHQPQAYACRPADSSAAPYSLPHQPQSRAPLARALPEPASEAWRQQPDSRQPYHMQPQQQQQRRRDLLQLSLQADMAAAPAAAAAAAVDRMSVEFLGGHYAAAAAAAGSQELMTPPYRQSRVTLVEPVLPLHPHPQQHQPQTRQPCHQHPRHQQQQQQQHLQQTEHPQQTEQVLQLPHQQRWVQQPQPQPQPFEDDYAMADAAAAAVGTQDEGRFLSAAQLVPPPAARQLPLLTQMEGRQQQLQQHQGHQQERHPDTGSTTEVLRSIILKLAHEQDQQQRV